MRKRIKKRGVFSRLVLLALLGVLGLSCQVARAAAPVVTAGNGLSCAGSRYGASLTCTAGEFAAVVDITNASGSSSCTEGDYFYLNAQVSLQNSNTDRYNIGFFTGENGNDPRATTGQCSVATFPTAPAPWFDADGNACGDFQGGGVSTPTVRNVRVLCTGNSNGLLQVPYVVTYQQNTGSSCSGPNDVTPGSKSKCDAGTASVTNVVVKPRPAAYYRFDECLWDGTAGEVKDSSGNGLDGTAEGGANTAETTPAISGDPGTCRYGVFAGGNQYVQVPDNAKLDGTTALTYAAWVDPLNSNGTQMVMGKGQWWLGVYWGPAVYLQNGILKGQILVPTFLGIPWPVTISAPTPVSVNTWSHVALVYNGAELMLFVNGSPVATQALSSALYPTNSPLTIGGDASGDGFNGSIDEARVYGDSLLQNQVQAVMTETHPCSVCSTGPDHLAISSSTGGTGVTCSPTTLTIQACADAAPSCTPYTDGVSGTLAAGGTPTVNWSGGTSFSIPAGSSTVAKAVQVTTPGTVTFSASSTEVTNPSTCNFAAPGSSNCTFASSDTGFIVTVPNHTAEAGAPLNIEAVKKADNSLACTPAFGNTTKTVNLHCSYNDPSSGTLPVRVDGTALNSSNNPSAACDGTGANITLSFNGSGVATPTLDYADVGRMNVTVSYSGSSGSLDNGLSMTGSGTYVSSPAGFSLTVPGNPGATAANGGVFKKAGETFPVQVAALNAAGNVTPNYGREIAPEAVKLTSTLVAPSGGDNPALQGSFNAFGTDCNGNAAPGVACGSFNWGEVGIVDLMPSVGDGDYLGAGGVTGTASGNVGRFTPDHFTVTANAPEFHTACAGGNFTYVGEPFTYAVAPVLTVTARNKQGGTTKNYTGAWWKISNATLTNETYSALSGSLDLGLLPNPDPVIADTGGGSGTLSFGSGGGIAFSRTASPVAPFDAEISLGIDVADADGIVYPSNPATFGAPSAGNGIAFDNGKQVRYGRLDLLNAYGSELLPLKIPLQAEYYDGNGFVTNSADSCTTYTAANLTLTYNYSPNLSSGDTSAGGSGTLSGGAEPAGGYLSLAAPTGGNTGSVDDTYDLSGESWLQFDWNGNGTEDNPSARATFGIYKGNPQLIYTRELYR